MLQVGFRTWYNGADQRYIEKCKLKDASTTQAALGFKICGMQVGMSRSTALGDPAGSDNNACMCTAGALPCDGEICSAGSHNGQHADGRRQRVGDPTGCRLGHSLSSASLSLFSHAAQELAASGFVICTHLVGRPRMWPHMVWAQTSWRTRSGNELPHCADHTLAVHCSITVLLCQPQGEGWGAKAL